MISKFPIISKNKIAQGTWEIGLGTYGKGFKFKAGQYIKVTLPIDDFTHPKGNMRESSITSSPNENHQLTFAFRESDSEFKQALLAHELGEIIKISGPFGDLVLPKDLSGPIIMIAGGMGITPFISMLSFINEQTSKTDVFLLYINSKKETTAYLDPLKNLNGDKKNIHFDFTFLQNRLSKKQLKNYLNTINKEAHFLVAGPPSMVRDTRANLLDLGVGRKNILSEEFTGY